MGSTLWVLGCFQPLAAQVVPDTTLPAAERSQVTGNPNAQIDGGARRGGNLFHSFQEFSVPTGGTTYFNKAADVHLFLDQSYITSRVFANGIGDAGDINIQAESVSSSQSLISASTQGQGNAGKISVLATGSIALDDSDISTAVQKGAIGNGQGINITARSLSLTNVRSPQEKEMQVISSSIHLIASVFLELIRQLIP
jgi:large exoprotein involved in heme utilization and adhesion